MIYCVNHLAAYLVHIYRQNMWKEWAILIPYAIQNLCLFAFDTNSKYKHIPSPRQNSPSLRIPIIVSAPWTCFVDVKFETLKPGELSSVLIFSYMLSMYRAADSWLVRFQSRSLLWYIGRSFFFMKGSTPFRLWNGFFLACCFAILSGKMHRIRTKTSTHSTKRNSKAIITSLSKHGL